MIESVTGIAVTQVPVQAIGNEDDETRSWHVSQMSCLGRQTTWVGTDYTEDDLYADLEDDCWRDL